MKNLENYFSLSERNYNILKRFGSIKFLLFAFLLYAVGIYIASTVMQNQAFSQMFVSTECMIPDQSKLQQCLLQALHALFEFQAIFFKSFQLSTRMHP